MTLSGSMKSLGNSFSGLNSSMSIVGSGSSTQSKEGSYSETCCYRRRRHCNRVYIFGDVNIGGYGGGYGCGGGYDGY